jgi:hypothetical protein
MAVAGGFGEGRDAVGATGWVAGARRQLSRACCPGVGSASSAGVAVGELADFAGEVAVGAGFEVGVN